jgi:hypothetical protein
MKNEKIIKKRRWVIPLFLGLGLISLILGTYFFMLLKGHSWHEIMYILLFEAAIIFFTATIIETLLLSEFGNRAVSTIEKLGKESQQLINNKLNELFELLNNADYNGMVNILPPRRDAAIKKGGLEYGEYTISEIRDALTHTNSVKILCVSGREFLWPREKAGFYDIFYKKGKQKIKYEIKLLVGSDYGAKIRGAKERPEEPNHILDDVERSTKETNYLNKAVNKKMIELKYYNFFPQAWLIITDNLLFIEPYNMADSVMLKNHFPEKFTDGDGCCGGRVPIFVFSKASSLYCAMNNYFDWLWAHDDERIFNANFSTFINIKD